MNILHTVHRYHPFTGGSEEVVRQLSEKLVSLGHTVTVATTPSRERISKEYNGVHIVEFNCSGDIVSGINGDSSAYLEFLRSSKFDIMMNYGAQIWCTDLVFDIAPQLSMKKVLIPLGYYRLNDPRYTEYFRSMPDILRNYDAVVYLSAISPDKEFADKHNLTNGHIIPNGTDLNEFLFTPKGEFRKKHGIGNSFMVLNVSNHSDVKNHPFFWKCVECAKDEGVTFVLIGNSLKSGMKKWLRECYSVCKMKGILHKTLVLENVPRREVVQAFVDADLFLFTSAFECSPLVMFESFAAKTLFVTTDCGNVKDFTDCIHIFKNEKEARAIINQSMNNPKLIAEKIDRAFEYVKNSLNWDTITFQYETLYLSLLGTGEAHR